jgi:hypothetical protein
MKQNISTEVFIWSFAASKELFYDIRCGVRHALASDLEQPQSALIPKTAVIRLPALLSLLAER